MQPVVIIDRGRGPELAGTRTTVYDVIPYLEAGRSANYIAAAMGHSTRQIEALIHYIEEHREEVMAVHRQIEERIARGNPPEIEARLAASPMHAVIQARLAAIRAKRAQEANGEGRPRSELRA
jgi:uncharacterized protein (DUF433 family)